MNFLAPLALLGLLTIPAILLLHLLRNRREPLDIPSLRLWRGLEQKKQGALPRRLPLSWMLLLQLLVAAALALGLARPALSYLLDKPQQTIFVLDITTSMAAEDAGLSGGPARRFDAARQIIRERLQAMGQQDTFAVVGLGPRPELLLSGDGGQKMEALLALDKLVPGATGHNLPAALTLANGLIEGDDREHHIVVLTDGNFTLQPGFLPVMHAPLTWQMFPNRSQPASNQALLNVSAKSLPGGRHRVFARLVNYSDSPVSRTLRLYNGPDLFAEQVIRLDPQAEAAQVWTLPETASTASVEIVEADALPLDNRATLHLTGATRRRALLLSDAPPETDIRQSALARALAVQPGLELEVDNPGNPAHNPGEFDLLVFNGLPPDLTAWPEGNLLVVNPPLGHPLLQAEHYVRNLRPDGTAAVSPLLDGVDLSGVYVGRAPKLDAPPWAVVDLTGRPAAASLEAAATGQPQQYPLIFHGAVGNSRVVVWAFDLTASNLPARLALPLLVANTGSVLLDPLLPPVVAAGEPVHLNDRYAIEIPGGRRLSAGDGIFARTKQPGLYRVFDERGRPAGGFAVHAGSALESNLARGFNPAGIEPVYAARPAPTAADIAFEEYWPWLAGLALAVVVIEGWLAWRR